MSMRFVVVVGCQQRGKGQCSDAIGNTRGRGKIDCLPEVRVMSTQRLMVMWGSRSRR